jgi:hypothetical protein
MHLWLVAASMLQRAAFPCLHMAQAFKKAAR